MAYEDEDRGVKIMVGLFFLALLGAACFLGCSGVLSKEEAFKLFLFTSLLQR